jgi:PAS domain-containing protein
MMSAIQAESKKEKGMKRIVSQQFQAMRQCIQRLQQQLVEVLDTREHLKGEQHTYQKLLEFAPAPYLFTTPDGIIRWANRAAARLFETMEKRLVGWPLTLYVPNSERQAFRRVIAQLPSMEGVQEWHTQMQPLGRSAFDVALRIAVVRGKRDRPVHIRWMITQRSATSKPRQRAGGDS